MEFNDYQSLKIYFEQLAAENILEFSDYKNHKPSTKTSRGYMIFDEMSCRRTEPSTNWAVDEMIFDERSRRRNEPSTNWAVDQITFDEQRPNPQHRESTPTRYTVNKLSTVGTLCTLCTHYLIPKQEDVQKSIKYRCYLLKFSVHCDLELGLFSTVFWS